MIGMLGEVIFNVSFDGKNKKILNFTNLKVSGGANFGKHDRRGHKPVLEFIDLNTDVVTLDITLRSDFGVEPKKLLEKLNGYKNVGEVLDFTLGNEPVGGGEYVITSYNAGYQYITNGGKVRKIDVSLTLEEYTKELENNIEIIIKPKKEIRKKIVNKDFNQGAISR